jgi:UPF0716 protein FxsA
MFLLLALVFVAAPILELYVIVQVADGIGIPETILLLIAISVVGAWLAKLAGLTVLQRLQATMRRGEVPSAEIVDGALVLFAGALMIAPGFISDLLALLLLLPPTRAVVRSIVLRRIRASGSFVSVVVGPPRQPGAGPAGEVWDVEGWEDPPERPRLTR